MAILTLRLLLGQLPPHQGTVRHGARLEVAYFDQLKAMLDEERTVQENVTDYETITFNGQTRHILGYLQDFLFMPERSRSLVRFLSGGERSRLLLARLFAKPSNVLVFDEPTNDLDMETLDLLASLLAEYQGTVLLVSHDRAFLNDVATSTLAIEAGGTVHEYAGGYDDYVLQRPARSVPIRLNGIVDVHFRAVPVISERGQPSAKIGRLALLNAPRREVD